MSHVSDARLDVTGLLAETSITLSDLTGLEVGDVITTEKAASAPVIVLVEGRRKFLAHIGQHKGKRALKVMRAIQSTDRV